MSQKKQTVQCSDIGFLHEDATLTESGSTIATVVTTLKKRVVITGAGRSSGPFCTSSGSQLKFGLQEYFSDIFGNVKFLHGISYTFRIDVLALLKM